MSLTGTTPSGLWPDELHTNRAHFEVTRDADGPGKLASRKPLAKRRAQHIPSSRQHTAEAHASGDHTIDLRQGNLRLGPRRSIFDRNARSLQTSPIIRPTLRKEKA